MSADINVAVTTWSTVPLGDIVQGLHDGTLTPPAPTVGRVEGGEVGLFYPGCVNGVAGESGSAKTWTALCVCAQLIDTGQHVLYFDLEDSPEGIVNRLLLMGCQPRAIVERFHYGSPRDRFDDLAVDTVRYLVEHLAIRLVVIDSTGEAMGLDGIESNSDVEVAAWFRRMPAAVAAMGPAVLLLDHTGKVDASGLWPIGSQRKRAAISGVQYMQQTVAPFAQGQSGRAVLKVAKDRHGYYPVKAVAAELVVDSRADTLRVSLKAPTATQGDTQGFRPTGLMERVSRALEGAPEPLSWRGIQDRVKGKREYISQAVDVLISEGYVTTTQGPRNSTLHTIVECFRDAPESGEHSTPQNPPSECATAPRPRDGERGAVTSPVPGSSRGAVGERCATGADQGWTDPTWGQCVMPVRGSQPVILDPDRYSAWRLAGQPTIAIPTEVATR